MVNCSCLAVLARVWLPSSYYLLFLVYLALPLPYSLCLLVYTAYSGVNPFRLAAASAAYQPACCGILGGVSTPGSAHTEISRKGGGCVVLGWVLGACTRWSWGSWVVLGWVLGGPNPNRVGPGGPGCGSWRAHALGPGGPGPPLPWARRSALCAPATACITRVALAMAIT